MRELRDCRTMYNALGIVKVHKCRKRSCDNVRIDQKRSAILWMLYQTKKLNVKFLTIKLTIRKLSAIMYVLRYFGMEVIHAATV